MEKAAGLEHLMGECDFTLSDEPSVFHSVQNLFYQQNGFSVWQERSGKGDTQHSQTSVTRPHYKPQGLPY